MHKKLFAILTSLMLVLSCTKSPNVAPVGEAYGTVTDADTQEPIQGVSVTLSPGNESVVTGSDGKYSFHDLDPDQYSFQFIKEGYESNTKLANVAENKSVQVDAMLQSLLPELVVSVEALDFGADKTILSFDISNSRKSDLKWSLDKSNEWISLSEESGTTTYGVSTIVVTIDRSLLANKPAEGNIIISSNAGSYEVKLLVGSTDYLLSATPEDLDFSTTESVKSVTLTNVGGTSSVSYTASSSNEWIVLSKKSGTVTTTGSFTIAVNRSNLDAGDYTGSVTIKPENSDQELTLAVKMTITSALKPTININDMSKIGYSGATCSGAIISVGSTKVTKYGFCWSTEPTPTLESGESSNLGDTATAKAFTYDIINLKPETKYYVVVYAQNSAGVTYSKAKEFTTLGAESTATVTTGEVSAIAPTSAKVAAEVVSLGNISTIDEYGHIWSSSKSGLSISLSTKTTFKDKESTGVFNSTIEGLLPNKTYYVMAYTKNSIGLSYGDVVSFTTLSTTPSVTTAAASGISEGEVVLNGEITDNGGVDITSYGFVWGTNSSSLDQTVAIDENHSGKFSSKLTSLTKDTKYYYQAYAKNENGIIYGSVASFTTSSANSTGNGEDFEDSKW